MICYTCAKKIIFFLIFWDNLKGLFSRALSDSDSLRKLIL